MAKQSSHKKRKANKNINPLRKKLGLSGIESFIRDYQIDSRCNEMDKMILLEPRDWLDYACVGATNYQGHYRAVYDLNLIEHLYALQFAYGQYKCNSIPELIERGVDCWDAATEWVDYNTNVDGAYPRDNAPVFIRSNDPENFQSAEKWHKVW